MRTIAVLGLSVCLAGCAENIGRAIEYEMPKTVENTNGEWWVYEHPSRTADGGKLMVALTPGRAIGTGLKESPTLGMVSQEPGPDEYASGARTHLDATDRRSCRIVSTAKLLKVQWEVTYDCRPAQPKVIVNTVRK